MNSKPYQKVNNFIGTSHELILYLSIAGIGGKSYALVEAVSSKTEDVLKVRHAHTHLYTKNKQSHSGTIKLNNTVRAQILKM